MYRCPERDKSVPRTPDPQMAFPQANAGALGAAETCPLLSLYCKVRQASSVHSRTFR
jgi:hypothetical protein